MNAESHYSPRRIEIIRGLGLGGAENLLLSRLTYEAERRSSLDGFRVEVINTFPKQSYLEPNLRAIDIPVRNLRSSSRLGSTLELFRLCLSLSEHDLVVVHSPFPALAVKSAKLLGLTRVTVVEVAHAIRYSAWTQLLSYFLNRFADICLPVSDEVMNSKTTSGFKKKLVVLGGVDRARFRKWVIQNPRTVRKMRAQLGVSEGDQLAVSVGNLYKLKGHARLIIAFRKLQKVNTHLAIIGAGPEQAALEELIHESKMADRIHLLGRQPEGWQWIAAADFLVHPSYHEGLPITLLEASALGVPILATDVGGARQVLNQEQNDILVASTDDDEFFHGLNEMLVRTQSNFSQEFASRASRESFWDVSEYERRFARALEIALSSRRLK